MQLLPHRQLSGVSAWSPPHYKLTYTTSLSHTTNNQRIAASSTDKYIYLYDAATHTLREKFPTKPADKDVTTAYTITHVAFDPTNTKLAVCQSDHIIYVYKLGEIWGDKKSICNKFTSPSTVTQCIWPSKRANDVVYITQDNKVRLGNCKTNKSAILYNTPDGTACSHIAQCTTGPHTGNAFITAHTNGQLYKYVFQPVDTAVQYTTREQYNAGVLLCTLDPQSIHSVVYTEQHVVVLSAVNNMLTVIHAVTGDVVQAIDLTGVNTSSDNGVNDCSYICAHPSGKIVLLASHNAISLFQLNAKQQFAYVNAVQINNLYAVTSMCWNSAGSQVTISNSTGCVDTYEINLKKLRLKHGVVVSYTSLSSVLITNEQADESTPAQTMSLASPSNSDIQTVTLHKKQYVVALTSNEMLIGDTKSGVQSAITYDFSTMSAADMGKIKYNFDNEPIVMVHINTELYVLQLGSNNVLTSIRTEYNSSYLLSVREQQAVNKAKKPMPLAYILDLQTIRVIDITTSKPLATVSSQVPIDWLTLNHTATKLLYRTTTNTLYIYDLLTQQQQLLLSHVSYVQCIPDSDVCVAQSHGSLHVYYNTSSIHTMNDTAVQHQVDGDVADIVQTNGQTSVVVENVHTGMTSQVTLDQSLIVFNTISESTDLTQACTILEGLTDDTAANVTSMWLNVAAIAYKQYQFRICARAYAAVGDAAKHSYMTYLAELYARAGCDANNFTVQVAMAVYEKQYKRAELLFVQNNMVNECVAMYVSLLQWEPALALAQQYTTTAVQSQLQSQYYAYLISSKQYGQAAALREKSGEVSQAIELYIQGGYNVKACQLLIKSKQTSNKTLFEQVMNSLIASRLYDSAGDLYIAVGQTKQAYDTWLTGHVYSKAIELARVHYAGEVVGLNDAYGDWLVSEKQYEQAVNAYIQSHSYIKAINVCIDANLYDHAVELLDNLDDSNKAVYRKQIGVHYAKTQQYELAEKYFVVAGEISLLVQLYIDNNQFDRAYKLVNDKQYSGQVDQQHVSALFVQHAQKLVAANKINEAEQVFTQLQQYDQCIQMYKKAKMYDALTKYVAKYKPDAVDGTGVWVAGEYKRDKQYKQAEAAYVQCKRLDLAVSMYGELKQYDDCVRLCKLDNTQLSQFVVTLVKQNTLSVSELTRLLNKHKLLDAAVDQLVQSQQYDTAVTLVQSTNASADRLSALYCKMGEACEDNGAFKQAESYFLMANKPRECIDMYIHQNMFDDALSVAQQYIQQEDIIQYVQVKYAEHEATQQNYSKAEQLYIGAGHHDTAIKMYESASLHNDALRVAQHFNPAYARDMMASGHGGAGGAGNKSAVHSRAGSAAYIPSNASQPSNISTVEQLSSAVKQLVAQKQYDAAVDTVLTFNEGSASDVDALCDIYQYSVQIANQHTHGRLHNVILAVASKMEALDRIEMAGTTLVSVDLYNDAIELYLRHHQFDLARGVAKAELPSMVASIDQQYQAYLLQTNNHSALSQVNPSAAIELAVKQNNWPEVYRIAEQTGEKAKYGAIQCAALIKDNKPVQALNVLTQCGVECNTSNCVVYMRLATDLLASRLIDGNIAVLNELKALLTSLVHELSQIDADSAQTQQCTQVLNATQYTLMHEMLTQAVTNGDNRPTIKAAIAKISITLLRYAMVVPVDKVYYQAGKACVDAGKDGDAFVYWNRYVDVCDRIVDHSAMYDIDNTAFEATDLPTLTSIPLPSKVYYSEDGVSDDVREWILDAAMSGGAGDKKLSERVCEKCGEKVYESCLQCTVCECTYDGCMVSGQPVLQSTGVGCGECGGKANKDEWNVCVGLTKKCPACDCTAQPIY